MTHVATVVALAAWDEVGVAAGRPHRARLGHHAGRGRARSPAHGLTVVTQPSFVFERGDEYQRDVEPADRPWLYRCRRLEAAGIAVGGSTDAPYGSLDPWRAMAAAVERRTRSGAPIGPDEAVSPARALALFLGRPDRPGGPPAQVEVGATADLCLLDVRWPRCCDLDAATSLTLREGESISTLSCAPPGGAARTPARIGEAFRRSRRAISRLIHPSAGARSTQRAVSCSTPSSKLQTTSSCTNHISANRVTMAVSAGRGDGGIEVGIGQAQGLELADRVLGALGVEALAGEAGRPHLVVVAGDLLDHPHEPGLVAVVGQVGAHRLVEAFADRRPSRSGRAGRCPRWSRS